MTTQQMNHTTDVIDLDELLETGLRAVETAMQDVVKSDVTVLREASTHILKAGGKRVRPRLVLLAYLAAGGHEVERVTDPAAAIELIHTASVVHDDINDHGQVRRGEVSVNARWGRTFALLTGDFLFTTVYELMAPYGDLNKVVARAATALVEGETLQAEAVKNKAFTSENYTRIIALKTAALFQAAAEVGARSAGASERQTDALKQYGYNVGLAFQIIDDILDIVGDEEKLGKTAGIDLDQGRGFGAVGNEEDPVESVKRKLLEGDRLQRARERAQMLSEMAVGALSALPDTPAKDELIALAEAVVNRDS